MTTRYDVACSCGEDLAPSFRFCPVCGAAAPGLPAPAERAWESLDRRVEEALVKVLRDVEDGHVGLWGRPGDVTVDRVVSGRLRGLDWPQVMLDRCWVAPDRRMGRQQLVITDVGRRVLGMPGVESAGR